MSVIFSTIRQKFARLASDRQGVAAIEFALILPLLMLLGFGVLEITRYVIVHERVVNAANSIADVISSQDVGDSDARYAQFESIALKKLMGNYWNSTVKLHVARFVRDDTTGTAVIRYAYPGDYAPSLTSTAINLQGTQSAIEVSVDMDYSTILPGLNIPGIGQILPPINHVQHEAYYPARKSLIANLPLTLDLSGVRGNIIPTPVIPPSPPAPTPDPPACTSCDCPGYPACPPPPPPPPPSPPPACTSCDCPGYPACPPPPPAPPPYIPPPSA